MADYVTVEQLRDRIGIPGSGENARLQGAVTSASRAVDGWCGRRFNQDAAVSTRVLTPFCSSGLDLPPGYDISTATGFVVETDVDGDGTYETTWTAADYTLLPLNGIGPNGESGWPYTQVEVRYGSSQYFPVLGSGVPSVRLTAKWGWPAVPSAVAEAAAIIATEIWKLKDVPFGADVGSTPQAEQLLVPYRRGRTIVGVA
jgi:hypothetical protein